MEAIIKKPAAGQRFAERRLLALKFAWATLLLVVGCQNSLRIKVELMVPRERGTAKGGTSTEADTKGGPLSGAARIARTQERVTRGRAAVSAAISSIETGVAEAKKALSDLGYSKAAVEGGQFVSLAMLSSACSSAREKLKEMSSKAMVNDVSAVKELETQFRAEVDRGLEGFKRLRRSICRRKALKDVAGYDAKLKAARFALATLEETAVDSSLDVAAAGCGGLEVLGVYELNQADPAYRQVLDGTKYQSVGLFSMAEANVNGDSTIVIVQENPGQFRVFEIDNDPTKLVQNVSYISNKALEAAVKYAEP